ncbi:hypothetical protein MVEG_07672 [Podila verticillata NRRL 6337]|nr:hypothetical protein MVEG_07672 [Podila verticillata NRRL 6337]
MASLSESTHTHGPTTLPRESYPTTTERKHTSKAIEDHGKGGQGPTRTTQDTIVKSLDIGVSKELSKGRNNLRSKHTDDNTEDLARWKSWCSTSNDEKTTDITPARFLKFMEDVVQSLETSPNAPYNGPSNGQETPQTPTPSTLLKHLRPVLLLWEKQYCHKHTLASSSSSSNNIPRDVEGRLGDLEQSSSSTAVAIVQLQEQVQILYRQPDQPRRIEDEPGVSSATEMGNSKTIAHTHTHKGPIGNWERRATDDLIAAIARGLEAYHARTRQEWPDRSPSPPDRRYFANTNYRELPRFAQGYEERQVPHGHKRSSSTLVGEMEGVKATKQPRSLSPQPPGYLSSLHDNSLPFKESPNARPLNLVITPTSSNSSSRAFQPGSPRDFARHPGDHDPEYSRSNSFQRLPPIQDEFEHYQAIQSNISSINRSSAPIQVDRTKYHHMHNLSCSSTHSMNNTYYPNSQQHPYHRRTHSRQQYPNDGQGHHRRYSSSDDHHYHPRNASSNSPPPPPPPIYVMNRQVNTVPELWKEWTVGLGPGNPSIRQLEAQYGPSWRTTSSAANFFSRRLRIINEIQRMIDFEGMSEEEAVNRLEMRREQGVAALNPDGSVDNSVVIQGGMSLHRLSEILRKKQL